MRVSAGVALLATAFAQAKVLPRGTTAQDLCQGHSVEEAGNWYCQPVNQITYTNVGKVGSYDEVVFMDPTTGQCDFATKEVSSPLAPFDEGLSIHFRGPITLKQVAVYTPNTKAKRDDMSHRHAHEKRRGHGHGHQRAHAVRYAQKPSPVEEREEHPTIWVTAVIDGKTVSWINDYWGPTAAPSVDSNPPPPPPPAVTPATAPLPGIFKPVASSAKPVSAPAAASASAASAPVAKPTTKPSPAVNADFVRTAYYSSTGTSEGLTFLGNYGGVSGSGTWSPKFGNTLSYLSSSGLTGAASAQTLTNTTIPSGKEFAIFSSTPCSGASCGYAQPGSVAYEGFTGADKTFLFEFQMPHDQSPAGEQSDVPALWLLNAKIPLTGQYSGCSCWKTGCGEFDVFEVLNPGSTKCKSTFHSTFLGGDSNYFERPVEETVKVAVVFDSGSRSVSVKVLDAGTQFGEGLGVEEVRGFMDDGGAGAPGNKSLFKIAS